MSKKKLRFTFGSIVDSVEDTDFEKIFVKSDNKFELSESDELVGNQKRITHDVIFFHIIFW